MSETDWLTRTRWIMYGAASSLIESLQDQEKAQANWDKYAPKITDVSAWESLAAELASKGAMTEAEARRYVEERLNQQAHPEAPPQPGPIHIEIEDLADQDSPQTPLQDAPPPSSQVTNLDPTPVSADDIAALMELTRQIETLRLDLEKRRLDGDPS